MDSESRIVLIDHRDDHRLMVEKMVGNEIPYVMLSNIMDAMAFICDHRNELELIFLNVSSPLWDGKAMITELENRGLMEYVPIVCIGDNVSFEEIDEYLDMGITDFFNLDGFERLNIKRIRNNIQLHMRSATRTADMAERDSLTGTLNFMGLRRRFTEMVRFNPDAHYIVTYGDIRNFKYFNSVFGYETGNRLLQYWVDSIMKNGRTNGLVCRVNADQVITVAVNETPESIAENVARITDDVNNYFHKEFEDYIVEFIVGGYTFEPKAGRDETFDQIIGYARQAQKTLKEKQGGGCAFYDDNMWQTKQRKIELNGHLDEALKSGEIFLNLQPQYNLVTGEIIGAECLCRWKHRTYGMVSPAEFIPALEESGRIYELDRFVWEQACKYLRRWLDRGKKISLAVNVSRKDISHEDLPAVFTTLVNQYGLDPSMLRIEITESVFMDDAQLFTDLIARFAEQGFSVEMDDFGSGYSSLNLLHHVNVDVLKLDMGFLRDASISVKSGNIINSIVKMAHVLNIHVLAEGVETASQAEFLKNIGCLMVQGYYFSKPIPVEEFEKLIENSNIAFNQEHYDKYQQFNIQELFDKQSSGGFIFNNFMGPAAIFEYSKEGFHPLVVNDELCSYIGWNREKFEKEKIDILPFFSSNNIAKINKTVDKAKREGVAVELIHINRLHKYCYIRIRVLSNEDDKLMLFLELTDTTRQKRLENRVDELQAQVNAQMHFMPCGTYTCLYSDGRILYASDALATLLGYDNPNELVLDALTGIGLGEAEEGERVRENILKQLEKDHVFYIERQMKKKDGTLIWVYENGTVVKGEDGEERVYVVVLDIDKQVQLDLDNKWNRKKLQAVMDMPGFILYEYDPNNDSMKMTVRRQSGEIIERIAENYLKRIREERWIHEDFVESYINTIKATVAEGAYKTVVAKAMFAGGGYHMCRYFFTPVMSDSGKVYRVVGRVERVEEGSDTYFEYMPVGTFRYEADGKQEFDFVSANLVRMLGFESEKAFRERYNNTFLDFVHPDDKDRILNEIYTQIKTTTSDYCEFRVVDAEGKTRWLYDRGTYSEDESGKGWFYVAVTDLNDYKVEQQSKLDSQKKTLEKLKNESQRDSMTKLYNHEYSIRLIQEKIDAGDGGILFMMDVDNFKTINDTMGHVYGDKVLTEIASILSKTFRENDVIGRYGGDEFICYVSGAHQRTIARNKAESVLRKALDSKITENGSAGISIGCVIVDENVKDVKTAIEMADKALYQAKTIGKGTYAIYKED